MAPPRPASSGIMAVPSGAERGSTDGGATRGGRARRCANCGDVLAGRFCGACGQRADPPSTLAAFVREWGEEVLGLDGRLARTFALLLFAPGRLSVDYLAGRRVRYVAPVRLFLGVNLATYLFAKASMAVRRFQSAIEGTAARPPQEVRGVVADLAPLPEGASRWEAAFHSVVSDHLQRAVSDPGEFADAVLEVLPAVQIAMLPLAATVLAVAWIGRRRRFLEHLLVATHTQAGVMAWTTLLTFGNMLLRFVPTMSGGESPIVALALIGTPVYVWLAMRRIYGGSWLGTSLRTAGVLFGWTALALWGIVAASIIGFFAM